MQRQSRDPYAAILRDRATRRRFVRWTVLYVIGTIVLVVAHAPGWSLLVAALGVAVVITAVELMIALRARATASISPHETRQRWRKI